MPAVCRVWNKRRTILLISIIYAFALSISLYHFGWRRVIRSHKSKALAGNHTSNATIEYSWVTVAEQTEPILYWYVQSSHLLFGFLVVVGPLIFLFILNCVIVYRLRAHNRSVSGSLFSGSDNAASVVERIRRRERRVTLTVVLLVSVFIVFNLPSGMFSVIEFLGTKYVQVIFIKRWYWDLGEVCNALVCTGKAVNFWLYCSASSDYRRELINVLTWRRCRRTTRGNDDQTGGGDRSRSTSRASVTSGMRHRRSNREMSEIYYYNYKGSGATAPV